MISQELRKKLEACRNLPTPPGVAAQIIALANDPEADMNRIAKVLATDPAITTKILRIANSPMYALQRKTENLRQALVVLGLNATISLALSFSLLKSWRRQEPATGIDYPLYWRRALLAATASQVLARAVGVKDAEELLLCSLIQDVGMMALDRSIPDLYGGLGAQQAHQDAVIAHELDRIGVDHAAVGGWLLERWNFPDRIQTAVAGSHRPEIVPKQAPHALFTRCVAVASHIAEVFVDETGERRFGGLAAAAQTHLGIDRERLGELLNDVASVVPDAETVFQTELLGAASDVILDEAREALMLRNLKALQTVDHLKGQAQSLEYRTRALEESSRRDPLTGLFNRSYLDAFLAEAFRMANSGSTPLSVAFADLDRFKLVNDTFGHASGDQILVTTANILKATVRSTDVVARYGGEEFILVFPETDYRLVKTICERIVKAFQQTRHDVGSKRDLSVTISVGMATHNDGRAFDAPADLIDAADKALYTAKLRGRNCSVPFDAIAGAQLA